MSIDLDDYVDVAERLAEFREKHPEGSLQPVDPKKPYRIEMISEGVTFVVYAAAAYRDPSDRRPGIGTAWEPFPGKTAFTKDSELQNAETSAWGRAIVAALAADTKRGGIASRDEVALRQEDEREPFPEADPIIDDPQHLRIVDLAKALPEDVVDTVWLREGKARTIVLGERTYRFVDEGGLKLLRQSMFREVVDGLEALVPALPAEPEASRATGDAGEGGESEVESAVESTGETPPKHGYERWLKDDLIAEIHLLTNESPSKSTRVDGLVARLRAIDAERKNRGELSADYVEPDERPL